MSFSMACCFIKGFCYESNQSMKIVQCWNDGVEDDIRLCELLRSVGAQAPFNLNAGLHGTNRGGSWLFRGEKEVRKLAKNELVGVLRGIRDREPHAQPPLRRQDHPGRMGQPLGVVRKPAQPTNS